MAEYMENFIKFYLLTHLIFSSKGNLQTSPKNTNQKGGR